MRLLLQHVFNKPGDNIIIRRELFNFIVAELEVLAKLHPHRILPMCVKLEDVRDLMLAFVNVLEEKFVAIANYFTNLGESVVKSLCLSRYFWHSWQRQ